MSSNNNIPQLRFPEFSGEWEYINGDELFDSISNKNHNSDLPILALTQDQGAVPRDMINYNVFVSDKSVAAYKVVEVDDFIISLRSFQGGIEYSRYRGLCSPAYIVLRKKLKELCSDFYRIYFKSFDYIQELNKNLEGIRDGKMISYRQFSEIKLPVPSFAEQQKIADCLSEMDNLISAQEQKVDALKEKKKGLMQQLFPQQGETIPRLRFPGFAGVWEEKKLEEVVERVIVGLATSVTPFYRERGVVMFRNLNIKPNILDDSDILYLDEDFANKKQAKKIHTNDVLTIHTGYVGISCVVPPKYDGALTFTTLITTTKHHILNPNFLCCFLNSDEGAKRISLLQAGGGRNNLNVNDFVRLAIPVPPTTMEQQKIAECLSAIDTLIASESAKLDTLKDHKKGLMQQLFPQPNK